MHKERDYMDWLNMAATGGIDWDHLPPEEMLTEELCIADLEDAPEHLEKIPETLKTFDVCFAAVYYDDDALRYVPQALRESVKEKKDSITEEEWLRELSYYTGNHYLKLPERLLTPEFCRNMIAVNGYTLGLIPPDLVTPELREIAAAQDEDRLWMDNIKHRTSPGLVKGGFQIVLENGMGKRKDHDKD